MRALQYLDEYKVSPRVTLRPGDQFRVSAGPYYKMPDGTKVKMAVSGLCTFERVVRRGARIYIEARHAVCGYVVLHVEGRRKNEQVPALVCRPYKIRGRKRVKK